jgi:hypothetical protein
MSHEQLRRVYRRSGLPAGLIVGTGFLGVVAPLLPVMEEEIPGWVKVLIWVLVVPFFGWLYLAVKRYGTVVDVRGIQVRTFVRQKRLNWADVQDIRAEPNIAGYMQSGAPTIITYAYGRYGDRVQLMYVDDRHVDVAREIDVLHAVWEQVRNRR